MQRTFFTRVVNQFTPTTTTTLQRHYLSTTAGTRATSPFLFTTTPTFPTHHTTPSTSTLTPLTRPLVTTRRSHFSSTATPASRDAITAEARQTTNSTTTTTTNQGLVGDKPLIEPTPASTTSQTLATTPNTIATPTPGATVTTPATPTGEMQQAQLPTTFPKFNNFGDFSRWYLLDPPQYHKYSQGWWLSNSWLMLMYSVTGYSALQIVRGVLSWFGIENVGLFKGDWDKRLIYFLMMTPTYSLMTLIIGTIFGRPVYSKAMVRKIWSRFFPWLKKKQE